MRLLSTHEALKFYLGLPELAQGIDLGSIELLFAHCGFDSHHPDHRVSVFSMIKRLWLLLPKERRSGLSRRERFETLLAGVMPVASGAH